MTNTPPTPHAAAAGWYPQPDGQQRYWDGQQWTEHLAPGVPGGTALPTVFDASSPEAHPRRWYAKKRVLIPVGALVLIGGLSQINGGDSTSPVAAVPSTTSTSSPPASKAPATPAAPAAPAAEEVAQKKDETPKIGSAVRDGKFEFVVSELKCGIAKVGGEYLNKVAQGQFCAVSLTVKNIGDEAQSMFAGNQTAFDAGDHKFSADSEAGIYAEDSKLLYEEINPGNSVKGKVYFDVPKGTKLIKLDLHDSAFSGGVEVALS